YASQGPLFRSVAVSHNAVEVECEGAEMIVFQSNTVWCRDRVATGGASLAHYEIKPSDRYVRIELIDAQGNRAWSSPFFVNED
ncbi:MAG: hypothetical protein P4L75_01415, partial [Clostridia bacterium]|nr:hypothetical protein [Clostridia bacterium]